MVALTTGEDVPLNPHVGSQAAQKFKKLGVIWSNPDKASLGKTEW